MAATETKQTVHQRMSAVVIACWRLKGEESSPGRVKLFEAVNDLWAYLALQEYQQ